jgi:hypothetical protein
MILAAVSHDISSLPLDDPLVVGGAVIVGGQKQSAVLGQSGSSITTSRWDFGGGQQPWLRMIGGVRSGYVKAGKVSCGLAEKVSCDLGGGEESVSLGLA